MCSQLTSGLDLMPTEVKKKVILIHRNCIFTISSANGLIPAAARHADCWAARSWLSFSNTLTVLLCDVPAPGQLDEGDRTLMPSRLPRWCSLLFIPCAFAIYLSTSMVMFAIYLFLYVKLNFLVFSSPFISSSCFTWRHLWNAVTLITCLTCKLMR